MSRRQINRVSRRFRKLKPLVVVAALAAAAAATACGDEVDPADELGLDEQRGRVEIVIVDSSAGDRSAPSGLLPGRIGEATAQSPDSVVGAPGGGAPGGAVEYDPEGEYTVQIAVFREARKAGERVLELSRLGYPAYSIARPDGEGVRVRIGYFKTRTDASRFAERFEKDSGSEYWIDRRTNEF